MKTNRMPGNEHDISKAEFLDLEAVLSLQSRCYSVKGVGDVSETQTRDALVLSNKRGKVGRSRTWRHMHPASGLPALELSHKACPSRPFLLFPTYQSS